MKYDYKVKEGCTRNGIHDQVYQVQGDGGRRVYRKLCIRIHPEEGYGGRSKIVFMHMFVVYCIIDMTSKIYGIQIDMYKNLGYTEKPR